MIRQNRRMGGGKSLVNLGKVLLSAIVVSAVILGENSLAKTQKSSKKGLCSASSKNATSFSTGDEIELDPASDFSYIKFTK